MIRTIYLYPQVSQMPAALKARVEGLSRSRDFVENTSPPTPAP